MLCMKKNDASRYGLINITKNNIIGHLVNTNFKGMIWLPFLDEKVLKTKHTYNYVKISQLIVLGKIPQNLEKHEKKTTF